MDDDSSLKPRFTQTEWWSIVRRAFGPVLASINLDDDLEENASDVLSRVKEHAILGAASKSIREYAFGCSLFGSKGFNSFNIGPVLFEPRNVWLGRKHKNGGVSTLSQRRIERAWQGDKLRKRKPSFDSFAEIGVLNAIGSCQFVCSITIDHQGFEAGQEKALMAAWFATTAIALTWHNPSKALNGINLTFDRQPHLRNTLTFISENKLLIGSSRSHLPSGLNIKLDEWNGVLKEKAAMLAVVGELLEYVISPSRGTARSNMMSTLFHAFLWFHEGCREPISHIAVAKMAASLDALACGRRLGGIIALINARLKMESNAPIRPGGPTLKNAIQRIYDRGRSRLMHGNHEELSSDWSDTKALAEQFGRLCLLHCLDWIANNPNCDDANQLRLSKT